MYLQLQIEEEAISVANYSDMAITEFYIVWPYAYAGLY